MPRPTFPTFAFLDFGDRVFDPALASSEMKDAVIEDYLKDLGSLKAALNYSTLATTCQLALEGRGPPDLKDQIITTIFW